MNSEVPEPEFWAATCRDCGAYFRLGPIRRKWLHGHDGVMGRPCRDRGIGRADHPPVYGPDGDVICGSPFA